MHGFKLRFRIYDLLFYLLLVFSFYYTRNMICRVMMVVFFGYTVVQMILRKSRVPLPFFYFSFLAFVLFGAVNVWLDNVINVQTARTMVVSLALNLMMIFAIAQYIYMTDDAPLVLRITELGIFTTAMAVVLLSIGTITEGRLGGGTEINANMLAILCVYGFTLTMYLRKTKKISRHSSWFRMGFYVLAILLTGSRKGLVMIVLAIVVVRMVSYRKKILQDLIIGAVALIGCYILIMNVETLYNIIGVRVENALIMMFEEDATMESSLAERRILIDIGLEYIAEKPWTGYGYDCFKLISGRGANGKVAYGEVGFYSHNNYIELLFGGGIVAFALYYIGILYLLVKLWRRNRKETCVPYLLAILVSKLSIEYYYVSSYERIDAYILAILLGCALAVDKRKDTEENRQTGELRGKERLE